MRCRAWSAGALWLASAAPDPSAVLAAWADGRLAAVPSGPMWLVAEAPLMHSVRAMGMLSRARRLGPVLVYPEADRAWWLVPPGAGEHLYDLALLRVHEDGWRLRCPPPEHTGTGGMGWLERPDGTGTLTDPAVMGAAFGRGGRLRAEAFG